MVENQLKRRNVNSLTKTYLVGRRYLLEKGNVGVYDHSKEKSAQNEHSSKTCDKIATQLSVGQATVRRASEFTLAVDKIVANTFYCALLPQLRKFTLDSLF